MTGIEQVAGHQLRHRRHRYNGDGSLDTTFSTDGKAYADFGGSDEGEDMALDSSGRIVIVGSKSDTDMLVVRFNTDGTLDTSFDTDGKVTVDFGSTSEEGETLMIQSDGKIVIAGRSGDDFAIARLTADPEGTGAERLYVQHDANFNVTALVDASGAVAQRYLYDAYGSQTVLTATWNTSTDAYGFLYGHQGGRYDPTAGLYHFNNGGNGRDYSPTLGRWLQVDRHPNGPYVDGMNAYQYVRSNPLVWSDPTGQFGAGTEWGWVPDDQWGMVTCAPSRRRLMEKEQEKCRKKCHEDFDMDERDCWRLRDPKAVERCIHNVTVELEFCIRRCNGGWHGPTPPGRLK